MGGFATEMVLHRLSHEGASQYLKLVREHVDVVIWEENSYENLKNMNVANKWLLENKPLEMYSYNRVNTETRVMLIGGYRIKKVLMYNDTM
jgi:hypothetical protein